ncbi:innexin shaking-B-like [Nilaparvata lugens]|uniref:innexin shaking-B-like n=1 Tax=Nilaparvata lugens TaxID=108931 RepID=UPI00193E52D0|nr:innexin shaking-B-like [Nilaparvata lugens]
MLAAKQFVGAPIECVHGLDVPPQVINTWCWIHSTYTVPAAFTKQIGVEVPYPGVDNTRGAGPADRKVYRFYQWVAFCLFFQVNTYQTTEDILLSAAAALLFCACKNVPPCKDC